MLIDFKMDQHFSFRIGFSFPSIRFLPSKKFIMIKMLLAGWLVLGLPTLAVAQQNEVIKDFKIVSRESSISLSPGETARIDLWIKRSERYKNREIKLSVNPQTLPPGLQISFGPNTTKPEKWMEIKTDPTMKPGNHTLVVYGKSPWLHRGTIIKVQIEANSKLSTQN